MYDSIGAVGVPARGGRLGDAPSVFECRVVGGKLRYVDEAGGLKSVVCNLWPLTLTKKIGSCPGG